MFSFWKGYLSGSNRGVVIVRLNHRGHRLEAKALFEDQVFGPSIVTLSGELRGDEGHLRLLHFSGMASLIPLDGRLILRFEGNFQRAHGMWESDIGTRGNVELRLKSMLRIKWWANVSSTNLRLFTFKHAARIYTVFLLAISIFGVWGVLNISTPSLILLLIPAPYLFRKHLLELIQAYRVRKIGPVELDPQPPMTPDVLQLIEQRVQTAVQQQVNEAVTFLALDVFFVLRTKRLLIWLAQNAAIDLADFNAYAASIGVAAENLDATLNAILATGCAIMTDGKLDVTERGQRYVTRLIGQTRPNQG